MPTVQELLLAARAAKSVAPAQAQSAAPQEDFSLTGAAKELGAFGLNALGVVGNTLDLPGSMVRDVARSVTSGRFHNPFDQLLTPFTDENRATGRQILEDLGMRKNRETGMGGWLSDPGEGARDVAGFTLEVLLDPYGPVGKAVKAPQAIASAAKATGRTAAAGVRMLPGGDRVLRAGGHALDAANRLRKKYFDRNVGGAYTPRGQVDIADLNRNFKAVENESLRFTVDASQLAEDIGWSVRGEVPDILEKRGAIARYLARADMRTASPVLEQDLVRDVAGTFPKDMTVRGIRLGNDDKYYALLEGLPDHVQFPVDQLKVTGDSLQTIPERLMPVLDEMRDRAAKNLAAAQAEGVDVAKHYDENGHEFFHQYMLDAQQHAILRQGGGLVHGHRSAALKIAAGQPEARNALFQSKGTVHGPGGLADIFKQPIWDDVNRQFSDLNESFAPDLRIKDFDGQVVQVLPGHVGFQHIAKFADKVGMEPIELWRKLGLDPERGWAKAEDVERALGTFKKQLDAEARAAGAGNASIYFGNQMFRNLIEGKNTAVKLVDPANPAAGHILPNGQTMRLVPDPKATLESLAKSYVGDKGIAERLAKEAETWGDKPLYEWFVDGERRLFTPDVHTDLATRFNDNLGKLRKASTESPVNQLDAVADSYQLIFKNRYSHLINEKMPLFNDKGLLEFIDNSPGGAAGSKIAMTLKEYQEQVAAHEKAKAALTAPFGPERDRIARELGEMGYPKEQVDAQMQVYESIARSFAVDSGGNPDDFFSKFSLRKSTPEEVGQDALRQPVHHATASGWAPEPGFPYGRPRLDKIGTGVGRQNHGWGWYSAESEDVARAGAAEMGAGSSRMKLDLPDADVARMMDYDAPLSQQQNVVQALRNTATAQQEFVDRFMAATPAERLKMFRPATLEQKAAVAIARLDKLGRSGKGALDDATGRDVLTAVTEVSSPKQASEFFRSAGIPGGKYVDDAREIGQGTKNFVVWDQDVLDRTALLEKNGQKLDALLQDARGAVKFLEDGKAIVHFFESKDVSTGLHEIAGHVARRNMPPKLQEMADKAFGVEPGASWSKDQEEAFASGIEAYFREGVAPTPKLKLVFQKFAAWLKNIYQSLMGTKLASGISDDMKKVFDRMLVPTLPDNIASQLEAGTMTQRTVNRHQGLAELLRDRENFREFGGFGNNPLVDHHEGTLKLARSAETAKLLQRFVADSLSNDLANRRVAQNYSRVRLAGEAVPGMRVEELMKNMPGLNLNRWLERTFDRLKANGTYAGELTDGIRTEILQHSVDPVVVKEFQDAFKLMNEVPVISDPLKWWDSMSNVMKSGLLATPSRINRDSFSSIVMAWTKGLLGIRDAGHIKNGIALMRGKPIGWAPDTDEIRALVKQAGGNPNSVEERLRVFKTLWASRSGHGGMHDVLTGDVFARETSGQADRLLDLVPGARGEGLRSQIKRDLSGQSLAQKANVFTNVAGTWYRDETGNWVQRSTNNALASISARTSNIFDKGIKLGTMMAVLEKGGKGMKFDDAYKQVSKALLNYQSKDFSTFERQVLKRIFPFYGFMSRSIALVAGELATNPGGRLAQTIRAQRSMQDSEGYTPYELQDTAAVPLGKDAENNLRFLTGFGLMHEDAMQYLAPTQGYRGLLQKLLGSANPVLKQPIEYALNTSTFFEGPMGGRRLDDLDPTMGRLKQLIGERIGLVDPLQPGQSPKPIGGSVTESMVASSPAAAWLRIARTGLDPRKSTTEKLLNIFSGVRTKTMIPEAQIREIRDRINAVEVELGARPLTLTVGNKKLEARARAEGDTIKADRLKAARKVLEHIRKASEK